MSAGNLKGSEKFHLHRPLKKTELKSMNFARNDKSSLLGFRYCKNLLDVI